MEETKNNYQKAARRRVERELADNPDKYKELGSKGGRAKVTKGIGSLSPERRLEISKAGQEAKRVKRQNLEVRNGQDAQPQQVEE